MYALQMDRCQLNAAVHTPLFCVVESLVGRGGCPQGVSLPIPSIVSSTIYNNGLLYALDHADDTIIIFKMTFIEPELDLELSVMSLQCTIA